MKITFRLLFLSICLIISSSCSNDDDKKPVVGNWKLTTWTVDIMFDLDDDIAPSSNFLNKTICNVNETLTFDKNGIVTSNESFNSDVTISLKDGTADGYIIKEVCSEGSVGFATSYNQVDKHKVELNGAVGIVENQKLTLVYADAVKIYNEALSQVIDTKDLTLVYVKKR